MENAFMQVSMMVTPALIITSKSKQACVITNLMDLIVTELESRFSENELALLCALSEWVLSSTPNQEYYDMVADQYDIDKELLIVEHNLFFSYVRMNPDIVVNSPRDVLTCMHENDQLTFLPHLAKVMRILNIIPVTSCSSERSFSALRRILTYLRSTMGQERLTNLALLCIERIYGNEVLKNDIEKIIDKFAETKNRAQYFF